MADERDRPGQGLGSGEMKQTLERETAAARQSAQNLGETVQRQAKDITSDLQSQAEKVVSEQKEVAKSGMMDLASAIRSAADELEKRQQSQVAGVARSLAGGIEDFSKSMSQRNFQDMMSDVQRFARDHPTAIFGGAVLAGLAIARFAKSSSPRYAHHQRTQTATGYAPRHPGQGGQLSEFARHEREFGGGTGAGSTR